jgi:diacylglycerol kinase (ATP)
LTGRFRRYRVDTMALRMIVNPNAGKKRGALAAEQAASLLRAAGTEVEMVVTEEAGHAVTLAAQIDSSEVEGVIAVGGDGTLFEVINGLFQRDESVPLPVGQIPVGTGNSFIKDLGIESIEDAVEKILNANLRRVDLGKFSCSDGTYYFVNILGAGFVSNVASRAAKYKKLGAFSYVLGVLGELATLNATPLRIDIDGETYEREAIFVEICNSRLTGGNMIMSPDSILDDGLLDVVIVSKVTRRKLLRLFPTLFKGTHVHNESVEVVRGKHITVESTELLGLNIDGETFGKTPMEINVVPGAIEMYG